MIITGDEGEESEDNFEAEEHDGDDDDDDDDDDDQYDDDCDDWIEDDTGLPHRANVKKKSRTFDSRRRKKNAGPLRGRQPMSAVTVLMRHHTSKMLFVWRTAGVKDTCGAELHEGESYRLEGFVQGVTGEVTEKVGVTRCRLTPIAHQPIV